MAFRRGQSAEHTVNRGITKRWTLEQKKSELGSRWTSLQIATIVIKLSLKPNFRPLFSRVKCTVRCRVVLSQAKLANWQTSRRLHSHSSVASSLQKRLVIFQRCWLVNTITKCLTRPFSRRNKKSSAISGRCPARRCFLAKWQFLRRREASTSSVMWTRSKSGASISGKTKICPAWAATAAHNRRDWPHSILPRWPRDIELYLKLTTRRIDFSCPNNLTMKAQSQCYQSKRFHNIRFQWCPALSIPITSCQA